MFGLRLGGNPKIRQKRWLINHQKEALNPLTKGKVILTQILRYAMSGKKPTIVSPEDLLNSEGCSQSLYWTVAFENDQSLWLLPLIH